jgi:hypothetical protein
MSTMNVQPIASRNADSDLLEKDAVHCQRCSGLMSYENFYDWGDDTGQLQFPGWRCFSCGNIWDHVIADHQGQGGGVCAIWETRSSGEAVRVFPS